MAKIGYARVSTTDQDLETQVERIKRRDLQYLKVAMRKDASTVQKAAEGILRFEASTGYASFKTFRIEQAIKFQDRLNSHVSKTTGKPLSKSTIRTILAANKGFIFWLADQTGYKSRIRHSDADYFNMDTKGARVASATRDIFRAIIFMPHLILRYFATQE